MVDPSGEDNDGYGIGGLGFHSPKEVEEKRGVKSQGQMARWQARGTQQQQQQQQSNNTYLKLLEKVKWGIIDSLVAGKQKRVVRFE